MLVLKLRDEVYELQGWEPPAREPGRAVTAPSRSGPAAEDARAPGADHRPGAHDKDGPGEACGDSEAQI